MPLTARAGRRAAHDRTRAESQGRERLLDVAVELFAARGIANTTLAQIAAAAQFTAAMVHYWFDTREKLLDAVVNERLTPQIYQIWVPGDESYADPTEFVRRLLLRMLDVTAKARWLPSLWLREIIQEGGLLRERVLKRIPADPNAKFRRMIVRAQERSEIDRDIAPELLFLSMLALVMVPQAAAASSAGPMVRRFNPGFGHDRTKLERHVMQLLLHGFTGTAYCPLPQRAQKPR